MRQLILLSFSTLIFTSCGTAILPRASGFQGKHISEAIHRLGPYDQTSSDHQGGTIYTWHYYRNYSATVDSNGYVDPAHSDRNSIHLFTDADDIVYHYLYE